MTSQFPRVASTLTLATLLTFAANLGAAAPADSQQQLEALRQLQLQALRRGDSAAAERFSEESKRLDAGKSAPRTGSLPLSGDRSFSYSPSGTPAISPADTSTTFTPPSSAFSLPAPVLAPIPSQPALIKPPEPIALPAVTSAREATLGLPLVTNQTISPPTPPPVAVNFTPLSGIGASSAPTTVPRPTASLLPNSSVTSFAEASRQEPRPADLPPAVLEIRNATDSLSKLDEFRMAEGLSTRRATTATMEPARLGTVPPPSAVMAPSTLGVSTAVGSSVSLVAPGSDLNRRLEEITRRRTELQAEADRLSKEGVDWEARYAAAKAELARLENQRQDRDRLQNVRDEISRLDADAVRISQELEASRLEQDRRAREALNRFATASPSGSTLRDRPMVSGSISGQAAQPLPPAPKGPPTFQSVGSSKPQRATSDGNIARTGRSGDDSGQLERDISRLDERRQALMREVEDVQTRFQLAERELATAARTGVQGDIERWTRERSELDARYRIATDELRRNQAESAEKISQLRSAKGGTDPDAANPGDQIQMIVAEDDSFNGTYRVNRDGNITIKNLGRVAVGGKQLAEAEAAVKAALEESQLNKATVTMEFIGKPMFPGSGTGSTSTTDQPTIIYLAGEFITPGPLKIPDGVSPTLITTIIRSGGITPSGDLTRAKLLRIDNGQGAVEEVNVAAILSGNIPPADIALNPGDIIMIPAFAPVVYVTGNVTKPGTLRLFQDETLTAYAAILRAGGFARFANLKKCTVVRDLGNGEKIQMPLNVKEIQKGLAPDIILQGKDIVVVPESFFSF